MQLAIKILGAAQASLPRLSKRTWLTFAIPASFSLAFVLMLGPNLQSYTFQAINSSAPTIYSTTYKDSIAHFYSLKDWLIQPAFFIYLAASLIIVVTTLRAPTYRDAVIYCTLVSFAVLLSIDIILCAMQYPDLSVVFQDIIADAIGAPIVTVICVIGTCLYALIARETSAGDLIHQIVGTAMIILFGIMVSTISYYVMYYIYQPIPAHVDLIISTPFSGTFRGMKTKMPSEQSLALFRTRPFDLLPSQPIGAGISINSPAEDLTVSWQRHDSQSKYRVDITIVKNCIDANSALKLNNSAPTMTLDGISKLTARYNNGFSIFEMKKGNADATSINIKDQIGIFWIDKDSSAQTSKLQLFLDSEDRIHGESREGSTFYISAPLVARAKGKVGIAGRSLNLATDIGARQFSAAPFTTGRGEKIHCSPANVDTNGVITDKDIVILGAIIAIRRNDPVTSFDEDGLNTISIFGANGDLTLSDIDNERLKSASFGKTAMLSVSGNVDNVRIDGEEQHAHPFDQISMYGEFDVDSPGEGKFRFSGEADAAWMNNRRALKTSWENLPKEIKFGMLSILSAMLLWTMRKVTPFLKRGRGANRSFWLV